MTDTPPANRNRAAILLIHGVGQQKPYQMLDRFARGLIDHYGPNIEKIEPELFQLSRRDSVRSRIRLKFKNSVGRNHYQELDLYEFYWAGMVQGQVSLRQMLRWCFKTSFPPLKLWSQHTAMPSEIGKRFFELLPTLIREFATAFGLLLAIGLVIFPVPYIAIQARDFVTAGQNVLSILQSLNDTTPGLFGAVVLFIIGLLEVFIILNALQILIRLIFQQGMETQMLRRWALASIGLSILLLPSVWALFRLVRNWEMENMGQVLAALFSPTVSGGLISLVLAYGASRFLIDFVGDIPLYVEADEKSSFYRTRNQIKSAGTRMVTNLLDEEEYEAVYLVGHSLGSVIAYETINQILREHRAGAGYDMTKLQGLLTFGSPLDKIYYFFRDNVGNKQAIRAQIQSFLHGFRRRSSGRDYGPYRFARYTVPSLKNLQWVNVYSAMDFVSDNLDFYHVDQQIHLMYYSPLTAHGAYWKDPKFYCILATLIEARAYYDGCLSG